MDLEEIDIYAGNGVDSARDGDYWRTLVIAALSLRVPQGVSFLTTSGLLDARCIPLVVVANLRLGPRIKEGIVIMIVNVSNLVWATCQITNISGLFHFNVFFFLSTVHMNFS